MTTERTHDPILWSTIAIALLVAITSVAGLFWPATYARETAYSRTGGYSSDLIDLFLVLPVLLVSGVRGYRGSLPARLVWLGTLGYLLYNFAIYAFGVRFNALFLVYVATLGLCFYAYVATLGLCFYAVVFSVRLIPVEQMAQTYGPRVPRMTVAIVFLVLAVQTAIFEVRSDVIAIVTGKIPQNIADANQSIDFVHVLDLAFLLPALCITAILLLRRKAASYALAPALLTLLATMSIEIAIIIAVMGRKGFGTNVPMITFFVALGVGFTALLWWYFSSAKAAAEVGLPSVLEKS